jgi:cell division septum initiation protein DivIVA
MRTEGLMPGDGSELQTMGSVQQPSMRNEGDERLDDLQRALEGELVGFLKAQNSKLMSELADLKSQLQKGSSVPANSGTGSTPWSAVDVTSEEREVQVGLLQLVDRAGMVAEHPGQKSENMQLVLGMMDV